MIGRQSSGAALQLAVRAPSLRWARRLGAVAIGLVMMSFPLIACGDDDNGGSADADIVYEANDGSATNVFRVDPSTGEYTQLTRAQSYDGQPAWSPDRDRIIYISDAGQAANVTDLYTMAADGSDVRRLTNTPDRSERSPKYAPDGSRIAVALLRGNDYFLATLAPDGSDEQVLAGPFDFVEFPSWRKDGDEIYFAAIGDGTQSIDILSVNVDSRQVTMRVSTPSPDVCPHFSFDGEYMTYARSPSGPNDEPDIFRRPVSSDDVSGAGDEQLTDALGRDDYGNPSPDDKRYVFLSNRDGNFDLYLMGRDGANVTRLTNTPDLRENVPDW
jgi:TolB protein